MLKIRNWKRILRKKIVCKMRWNNYLISITLFKIELTGGKWYLNILKPQSKQCISYTHMQEFDLIKKIANITYVGHSNQINNIWGMRKGSCQNHFTTLLKSIFLYINGNAHGD